MKSINFTLLLILALVMGQQTSAQVVYDSVSVQMDYANTSFYSLQNGEKANVSNTNWDIAFDASGFGYTIRVNTQKGNRLYVYPGGDNSAWATIDTTGMSSWSPLYNSDTAWWLGAFNVNADPGNSSDLGWGVYNLSTHHINGDSLFIMKWDNGDIKKIDIKKLASKVYSFRYANLDGSDLVDTTLDKTPYSGKNFVCYSLLTDQPIDREPLSEDWDIAFTKYSSEVAPMTFYGVTGVLHNKGVEVAKAAGIANPKTETNYSSFTFTPEINTIGYDWKKYNFGTSSYDIQDSLAFFIKAKNGSIWRLVLTDFEGSGTGKIKFEKELLAFATSVQDIEKDLTVAFYPNPVTTGNLHIVFDANKGDKWTVQLYSMNGKLLKNESVLQNGLIDYQLSVDGMTKGTYFVKVSNNKGIQKTEKIILGK